jgi:hypothetical protein
MRRFPAVLATLVAAALVLLAVPAAAASGSFNVIPKTVRAGQTVKAYGNGCPSRAFVRIRLDGRVIDIIRADPAGGFATRTEIPDGTTPGQHRMSAGCRGKFVGEKVTILVKAWRLRVSPRTVEAGDFLTVVGRGCRPGSLVVIKLDGKVIGFDRANERGAFRKREEIPGGTSEGKHVVSARCSGRFLGSKSIRVIEAYPASADLLTVSRSAVPAGQAITISGADCPDRKPVASLDGQPLGLTTDQATKGKGFTATATIPRQTSSGRHRLSAGCDAGTTGATELQVLGPAGTEPASQGRD